MMYLSIPLIILIIFGAALFTLFIFSFLVASKTKTQLNKERIEARFNKIANLWDNFNKAKKTKCTCSGFGMQYNGGCSCGRQELIDKCKTELEKELQSL